MKRAMLSLVLLAFVMFAVSYVSAEIAFVEQPSDFYNMGEVVDIPVKITTSTEVNNFFSMNLLCNGVETEIHKEYIHLQIGEQKEIRAAIPLVASLVGNATEFCKVKTVLGSQSVLSNEFEVSNKINVEMLTKEESFDPGKEIFIEGKAVRENGENVKNGVVSIEVVSGNNTLEDSVNTVDEGYFFLKFSLPEDTAAGKYLVKVEVYELDFEGEKTNTGFVNYNLRINQIPKSLEIVFENQEKEVKPGEVIRAKAILRDQTGEKIGAVANVTIKNEEDEIVINEERDTDEFFGVSAERNQPPVEWKIYVSSEGLNAESYFDIKANKEVAIEFINKTLLVTNVGNVPYNDTLVVNVGNESLAFDVSLDVDESQKYVLSAPDGNYPVDVFSDGKSLFSGDIALTGKTIGLKQASEGVLSLIRYPIVWIFVLLVLGFVSFMLFRRSHNKSFVGKLNLFGMFGKSDKSKKSIGEKAEKSTSSRNLLDTDNVAEFSLSIQGDKHAASVVCLRIKNFGEVASNKKGVEETLKKLSAVAEHDKAMVYENNDNIFFVLSPEKTKTFKNEVHALAIAKGIKEILDEHNKLLKQKIEFGICIHSGTIVAKQEGKILKFMSLGNFISGAKKLASVSSGEIYLSRDAKNKMMSDVKTKKHTGHGTEFYTITDVRNRDKSSKFINDFLRKMEEENKSKKK